MSSTSPAAEISLSELAALLHSGQPPLLVEVLGPEHYGRGHLPGALNLPLEGFVANAERVLPDLAAPIVVYCASATCANSHIAQQKLQALGYRDVRVFKGGKAAWRESGRALELLDTASESEQRFSALG